MPPLHTQDLSRRVSGKRHRRTSSGSNAAFGSRVSDIHLFLENAAMREEGGMMAFIRICMSMPVALLVLMASVVPVACFYIGRTIYRYRRKVSKLYSCTGCVPATVTKVELEPETWREGWVLKAEWIDKKTRQSYTFSSSPQELRPKQHVGDNVLVLIESSNPLRYTLEL